MTGQEFESHYRVIGFGDSTKRMALYDLERDDTVWVNTVGYVDGVEEVLQKIQLGNVVEATVTNELVANDSYQGEDNEYWSLVDIEIVFDSKLYYYSVDQEVPGPIEELWSERDDEEEHPVVTSHKEDESGDVIAEMQIQEREVSVDGEIVDTYTALQRGDLLLEPLYNGNGTDFLEDGANIIFVIRPEGKDYVVTYLFPEPNELAESLFENLEGLVAA